MKFQPRNAGSGRMRAATVGAFLTCLTLLLPACQSAVNSGGGERQEGGVVTIVQAADISPLSFLGQNNPNFSITRNVFNTLTRYDIETHEPQPELATSWEQSEDGTSITLQLRDDVTFHSGRAFTADDVIFTIEAMLREDVATQFKHIAQAVENMTAEGEHTVTIDLKHPVSNLFDMFELMPIVDEETFDEMLDGEEIIGTGPFKVDEYTPGSGVTMSRYDDYWEEDKPTLDGVEISVQSQSQSMLSSLRSGQSQIALDMAPLDTVSIADDPGFEVITSEANDAVYYVGSNVKVKPLDDKRVRQAIAWAIDRDRILAQVLGDIGETSSLPWSITSPAHDAETAATYTRDIDQAKQLLQQAGADGASVDLVFDAGYPTAEAIAEVVQFDLNEAGLDVKLRPLQTPDFFAKLSSGGLPGLFVNVHGFGQSEPATLVKGAFPFNADANASNFDSEQYRKLADTLWTTTEPTAADYEAINEFLIDEQFVSDLVVSAHTYAISSDLKGLEYDMYDGIDLSNAYLTN